MVSRSAWLTHHSIPSAPETSWPYLQTNCAFPLPLTIKMEKKLIQLHSFFTQILCEFALCRVCQLLLHVALNMKVCRSYLSYTRLLCLEAKRCASRSIILIGNEFNVVFTSIRCRCCMPGYMASKRKLYQLK